MEELRDKLAKAGATVHVLEQRELENYLAVPRALATFIQKKRRDGGRDGGDVTEEKVAAALEKCGAELRTITLRKRVVKALRDPVAIPSRLDGDGELAHLLEGAIRTVIAEWEKRRDEAADMVEREARDVDHAWTGDWRAVAPGDELLDAVCRQFGVRFKKNKDGATLAALLTADEVPKELSDLLRTLSA
ncbi:hypothetical protein [Actinoplanes rectilineatus]|uniref:hypothetical protein n=1 Tax=Actinoplanes rectilineatus TaxID=113571 RepID=UPI0005F2C3C1|nr:hypothetical protein [Actinoplanes rectilineatus]